MELRKTSRKNVKIKMALQGPSGSGKTMSALLLAQGLTNGNLSKVAIIDTENGSADLYAHLGNYSVLTLENPHSPQRYIEAIDVCIKAGVEVIIIDSTSHCWDYLIDYHASLPGNSFTNWSKITPMQKSFTDKILNCNAHVIATMRVKQDYVLNEKNGKMVPEKVGLKAIQRDEVSYEFSIVLDLDIKHFCIASKDRTQLFDSLPPFKIDENIGTKILNWCSSETSTSNLDVKLLITSCTSIEELTHLYKTNDEVRKFDTELHQHAAYLRSLVSQNGANHK